VTTEGSPIASRPLGYIVDANPAGSPSYAGAVIDWSDDTTSSPTVSGGNGLLALMASKTYAAWGAYPLVITLPAANGWLLAQGKDAADARPAEKLQLRGPTAVPGMSEYEFYAKVSDGGIPKEQISNVFWEITGATALVSKRTEGRYWPSGMPEKTKGLALDAQFKNERGDIYLRLRFKRTVAGKTTSYESQQLHVFIVKVQVETPAGAFKAYKEVVHRKNHVDKEDMAEVTIDGEKRQLPTVELGAAPGIRLEVPPPQPGFEFKAKVTIQGPGGGAGEGVNKIVVGFMQYIRFTRLKVFVGGGTNKVLVPTLDYLKDKAPPLDRYFLDTNDYDLKKPRVHYPFYEREAAAMLRGSASERQKTIASTDTPSLEFPLRYKGTRVDRIEHLSDFKLYVVAQTTESGLSANNADHVFNRLAQVEWSFNASGRIVPGMMPNEDADVDWKPEKKGETTLAGVFPPKNGWELMKAPSVVSLDPRPAQPDPKDPKDWVANYFQLSLYWKTQQQ
jgi:hypothetical protein